MQRIPRTGFTYNFAQRAKQKPIVCTDWKPLYKWENWEEGHFDGKHGNDLPRKTFWGYARYDHKFHAAWLSNAICNFLGFKNRTIELRATRRKSSKTGSRRQSDKKTILKRFLKGMFKGKLLAPKLRKSADKSLSQRGCSHSNTIYDAQLQKAIVLRMQPLYKEKHKVSCSGFLPKT